MVRSNAGQLGLGSSGSQLDLEQGSYQYTCTEARIAVSAPGYGWMLILQMDKGLKMFLLSFSPKAPQCSE